ncbi:MAG: hypothetical protein CMC70_09090 [Flavobacteriaceae bacterium]|nr:hypothetical protein [Flavobacteriaceae bacterium]
MSKLTLYVVVLLVTLPTLGQVGINTTDPQETLHVNGKIRLDNFTGRTSVSVMGIDATGTLNTMNVGGALEVHNNTIIASGTGYYSVVNVPISTPTPNTRLDNIDLGVDAANAYKTVIRFTGQTQSFDITGIQGGIEGRHIILLNPENVNMGVLNNSNQSLATNRITTYGSGPSEATSGQGAIEMVYDGTRWVVLNLRN